MRVSVETKILKLARFNATKPARWFGPRLNGTPGKSEIIINIKLL